MVLERWANRGSSNLSLVMAQFKTDLRSRQQGHTTRYKHSRNRTTSAVTISLVLQSWYNHKTIFLMETEKHGRSRFIHNFELQIKLSNKKETLPLVVL